MANLSYFCSRQVPSPQGEGIYLIGIEFDGTACFRKGAQHGPKAIREVSRGIEDYSPHLDKSLLQLSDFYDLGDIGPGERTGDRAITAICDAYRQKFSGLQLGPSKLVTLGGEHSISLAPLAMYLGHYEDLVVIHLDAHADLRDGYQGHHYSHASVIRRIWDYFAKGHKLLQYGIRSGTREEYRWMGGA